MSATYYSQNPEYDFTVENFTPLTGASGGPLAHTFDVNFCSATAESAVNEVNVLYDDGAANQGSEAASAGVSPEWSASVTYPAAGTYQIKIQVSFTDGAPTKTVLLTDPVVAT